MRVFATIGVCLLTAATATTALTASAAAGPVPAAAAAPGAAPRTVTLITGDRLLVSDDRVSLLPATGRTGVRFLTRRIGKHVEVLPADAVELVNAGLLDRRLFDVTQLLEYGYDDSHGAGLPLIVAAAKGSAAKVARGGLRTTLTAAGASAVRELPGVNGLALRQDRTRAAELWKSITATPRTLAPGVGRVWLDGRRDLLLDVSVPQIGAPTAWAAGYTGAGVGVGVVDTGIDETHPDLAGRVVAARNFTTDPDTKDTIGHGTHVASTIAGATGTYQGVAPGAELHSAKVCLADGCQDSAIIDGMTWAAAEQRVKVVNLSLGGPDSLGTDPIEQAVADLTTAYGTLFVIATGNNAGTVSSPASADASLAVGAVAKDGSLAPFSNRGPRLGDAALKPEITAPGVAITAARSANSPGTGSHVMMSGTSMATPHVVGAAAILAQQHPDWAAPQLKAALIAAAAPNPAIGVFAQGAGRVDIGRAIHQTVTTSPPTVSLGQQIAPHDDDGPITRAVAYRNAGAQAVTLALAMHAAGPGGGAAPAGMFSVSAPSVTVPAGGEASVEVTANTAVTSPDGLYGGNLTATAGDLVVQTPVAVDKQIETYELKIVLTNRSGGPGRITRSLVAGLDSNVVLAPENRTGTIAMRLPKGRYLVESGVMEDGAQRIVTEMVQPELVLDRDRTVAMDARLGKRVTVAAPQPGAVAISSHVSFSALTGRGQIVGAGVFGGTWDGVYSARIGPDGVAPHFAATVSGAWAKPDVTGSTTNSPYAYFATWHLDGRFPTGYQRAINPSELATVQVDTAADAARGQAVKMAFPTFAGELGEIWGTGVQADLPSTRTEYYTTGGGVRWNSIVSQSAVVPPQTWATYLDSFYSEPTRYQAGRTYRETWNQGVFSPAFPPAHVGLEGVYWQGNTLVVAAVTRSDDQGRSGSSWANSSQLSVLRDGKILASLPRDVGRIYDVPSGEAPYRISVARYNTTPGMLSTQNVVSWTFRSSAQSGATRRQLPLSVVRLTPRLSLSNTAPAGVPFEVPFAVQHQPGAATGYTKSVEVQVSYDDGKTWTPLTVRLRGEKGIVVVANPATGGHVSFKLKAVDDLGNTVEQTILRAYRV